VATSIERFGPYLLGPLLGRGGMGEVHRATDTSQDGRVVALKRLAPHLSANAAYRERFRRECEAAARLDDPHVVPIHRYGEIDGRLFLDMQLLDGRDLAAELTHAGPMHPARAVAIVAQVAAALDAAHAVGLVHRDVKPSNILLAAPTPGRPDFAQLTDFGIAAGPAGDGGADGTVEYLAPERLLGTPADRRVDVYSLACVLHELVTGLRAFPGADFAAQVHGHLYLPPPRPTDTFGWLPPGLDMVVARGLAKDPAHRHPSAGALADEARAALGTGTALAGPPRTSRRRLLVGAAGAVVLAGAGALAVALTRTGAQPAASPAAPVDAGPPPEPVIEERVLGVRSTSPFPFATTQVGGRPAILVDATDSQTHLRDVTTDRDIAQPVPNYEVPVGLAEVVEVDGRDVLVSLAYGGQLSVVDLQTGSSAPVGVHDGAYKFAAASGNGVSIAATTGLRDGIVRRWDLRGRAPLGEPLSLPEAAETGAELSTAMIDGRLCVVAQVIARNLTQAWDAATGEPVVRTNATGEITLLDGVPVLVGIVQSLNAVDLRTGAVVRRHEIGRGYLEVGVPDVLAVLDDRPVLVTEGERGTIVVWDVDTGRQLGQPIAGHQAELTELGVADLNGRPILVSGARDNTIRVWDLAVRAAG
jgi:protein kinase-like protein